MHQHITAEHCPLGHHRLMPGRVSRRRQQPHPAQPDLTVHHSELPGVHDRPDHPLVRRPAAHMLELLPLYDVLRVLESRPLTLRAPPHVVQMHMGQHHGVDVALPDTRLLQQPRQPPTDPQPLSRLASGRPHPCINQYDARVASHEVAVEVQPPPTSPSVPWRHLGSPVGVLGTPPRQRLLNTLRKHRHRIAQHRHVHALSLVQGRSIQVARPAIRIAMPESRTCQARARANSGVSLRAKKPSAKNQLNDAVTAPMP